VNQGAESLEGYDCEDTQVSGFNSILSTPDCSLAEQSTLNESSVEGLVLQQVLQQESVAKVCKRVKARRKVYCNWMIVAESKMDPVNLMGFEGDPLSPHECLKLFETGQLTYKSKRIQVTQGEIKAYTSTTKLTDDGLCKAWSGNVDYYTYLVWFDYKNVTLLSGLDAHVTEYTVDGDFLDKTEGEHSGQSSTGYTAIWEETTKTDCFLREIYRGNLTLVADQSGSKQLLIKDKGVGLSLSSQSTLCNVEVVTTNVPFVYYVPNTNVHFSNLTEYIGVELHSEAKSLIQGLFVTTSLGLEKSATEIRTSLCALEQKVIRDVLYGVMLDPDVTAYKQLGIRGWRMVKSGAAIGLLSCNRLPVKINPQNSCYTDIPVLVNNKNVTEFMDPITHVIHSTSLVIPCDDPRVPLFKVDDVWYKIGTLISRVPAPVPFASVLITRSKAELQTSYGLTSDELIRKRMLRTSLNAARRKGELLMIADHAETITGVDQDGYIDMLSPLGAEERKGIHFKNIAAFLSPVVILTIIASILYGLRSWIFRKLLATAEPDVAVLKQFLPR